ncbi:amino acid adenylation domain-containing protein, partial [Mucilaginibacter angelicae]
MELFNNSAVDYPVGETLVSVFSAQAVLRPEAQAVVCGSGSLTYHELDEKSDRLSSYLVTTLNVRPNDLVGLLLDRSCDMIVGILGILKAGAAYVPIDPAYPASRKAYLLEDSGLQVLITQMDYLFDLSGFGGTVFAIDVQLEGLVLAPDYRHPEIGATDLAYVIYTSGSTGNPKGVMIEHGMIVNTIYAQQTIFEVSEGERCLQFSSPSFDASVWEIFMALASGGVLYIISEEQKRSPLQLEAYLEEEQISIATLPPAYLKQLRIEKLSGIKKLVTAGEAAIAEKAAAFNHYGTYYNAYGPTESSICATIFRVGPGTGISKTNIPIGKPIPNTEIYILDAGLKLQPVGVSGEICIGGAGVARGYLNREELSAEKFIANPFKPGERLYRTGDLGRWLADGNIEYHGRLDDQVKVRGYRIELGEIESALNGHSDVSSSVVQALDLGSGERELVAYVVSGTVLNVPELRQYLQERLPGYMVPGHYVQLEALPLTANGKVDKKRLPSPAGQELSGGTVYEGARNGTEARLIGIWEEVLGRNGIGIHDNFFDLGGHSLKATRLAGHIHKEFGVKVSLRDLFSQTVLVEQAELISAGIQAEYSRIPEVGASPDYVLSSSQRRLWVLGQLSEANVAYNMPGVYEFRGELDAALLSSGFSRLISRHEVLRTVFRENGSGDVRQYILSPEELGFHMKEYDFRGDEDAQEQVKEEVREFVNESFDLAEGPLLRALLCRLSEDRWVFAYVMHHIISDGWSMEVLIGEVLGYYNSGKAGSPV